MAFALDLRNFSTPISNPIRRLIFCINNSFLDLVRVLIVATKSLKSSRAKSSILPLSLDTIVPVGNLCSFRTRLESVKFNIASSKEVLSGAEIATGMPFLSTIDTAVFSVIPDLRWPVTCSLTAAPSIEITASGPPFPSRSTKPSGNLEPMAPILPTSPSRAAVAAVIILEWSEFASVQTAIAISPV